MEILNEIKRVAYIIQNNFFVPYKWNVIIPIKG